MNTTSDDEYGDLMSALDNTEKAAVVVPDGITVEEVQQYAKLDKAIKKAKPRWEELGKKIKAAYKKKGTFAVLNLIVKRTTAEKIDWKKVEIAFPQSEYPDLYKKTWTLDQETAKASLNLKPYTDIIERVSIDALDTPPS
jgi:hypothetical protein